MSASDRIRDAVAATLQTPISEWSGPHDREWSWHFSAVSGGVRLLVKVPRWEGVVDLEAALAAGPQPDTEAEHRALVAIAGEVAASGDPALSAVTPVAYVPAVNAIVMERLASIPLRERLGAGRGPGQAEQWFEALGRWLARYHGLGDVAVAGFPGDAEAGRWEELSGSVPGQGRWLRRAAAAARRLDGVPTRVATLHGDLTMSNVLVTADDRVAVIDPNRNRGRVEEDAARVLTEASLGRGQLLTLGATRPRSVVSGWAAALCRGHGGMDADLFEYERGAEALRRRIGLIGAGGAPRVIGAVNGWRFRGEFRRRFGA